MSGLCISFKVAGLLLLLLVIGPPAVVGCLAYILIRRLGIVYPISIAFGAAWVVASNLNGGFAIGPVHFQPHEAVFVKGIAQLPLNVVWGALLGVLGIKIGYAFSDGLREGTRRRSG